MYLLETPYRDGTTHVVFEPLDFIARLAALVPRPRVNLTRYHGVLAPNPKPAANHGRIALLPIAARNGGITGPVISSQVRCLRLGAASLHFL